MKKTIVILLLSFLTVGFQACDDEDVEITDVCIGCDPIQGSHFFTGIQIAEELVVQPYKYYPYGPREYDYTSLLVMVFGKGNSQFLLADREEFKRLATAIGDTAKENKYRFATPADNETLNTGISAVSLKALSHYNEAHPQGSSLKDIIRINFASFDHNFNSELKPKDFLSPGMGIYSIEPNENFAPIKYPSLHNKSYPTANTDQEGGSVMSIEFVEPPLNAHSALRGRPALCEWARAKARDNCRHCQALERKVARPLRRDDFAGVLVFK